MEQQTVSQVSEPKRGNAGDPVYDNYLGRIAAHFRAAVDDGKTPLFTTDAQGLWEAYLAAFPDDQRQFHNCTACRHFIERFGGLVWISSISLQASAIWDEDAAPELYKAAIAAMSRIVRRANVTGVFLSSLEVLGQPETGVWRHFAVRPPPNRVFKHALKTAGQAMAEKSEDFITVSRALAEFTPVMLDQALTLLKSEALYRSEKVLGQAQWLRDLHTARAGVRGVLRDNVLWRAIADAPAGFCHPRASMIGTLLEDIAAGLDFGEVSRKFAAKMHPLAYQRPQAAPSAGNIAQAEKIVEKLGIGPSLERRFARLDEVQTIWTPAPKAPERQTGAGVFGHLEPKGEQPASPMRVPPQVLTWEKFARAVLPDAKSIELLVPAHGNFAAMLTAQHFDSPPILQWDTIEQRNPVSHYVYSGGSSATSWDLTGGTWTPVSAVTLAPASWFGAKLSHQGEHAFFLLEGCKDKRLGGGGNALFPENLKAELREVRSTIEAYSRTAKIGAIEEASACGIMISKANVNFETRLRVTNGSGVVEYKLDRFD